MNRFIAWASISIGLVLISLSALSEENTKPPETEPVAKSETGAAAAKAETPKTETTTAETAKTEAAKEPAKGAVKTTRLKKSSQGCLADEEIIEDLRQRKENLETRLKDIEKRESEIVAKERALEEEMKKLSALRDEITGVQAQQAKAQEEKVAKLVETFETMTPKAIAQMLNSLDERLAVEAMSKISTQKLAKIMNIMEPGRSSRLSELLAGVVRARGSIPKSQDLAAATPTTKGGESNGSNSINDQSASSSGGKRQPAGSTE